VGVLMKYKNLRNIDHMLDLSQIIVYREEEIRGMTNKL
jgi:hypothetical protein